MRKSKVIAISILLIVTISCVLTIYNKSYATETKDIPNGKGITGWDIYTEDIKVEIRENENQKIIIYASSENEYKITENIPNRFNIEWKMQDETIAKYTASEGEEIASGFVVAGSVEIEGLKAGTTKLLAKVTEKGNDKESLEFEVPITVYGKDEDVIIGWDFSLNKKEMKMDVGSSDELMIFASTDGQVAQVLVKDYWNVEYKMEDETIAKYTAETGLETTSGNGTAGKAKIEGLKAGTTKLLITVSKISLRSNGEEYTESIKFEVPITVKTKETKKNKEDDNSQAKKPIPQTGDNNLLIPIIVTGIIFTVVILKRKITYKDE